MKNSYTIVSCYHCGNDASESKYVLDDKHFCCNGCKTVYGILNENNLCEYYELNEKPGLAQNRLSRKDKYAFLEDSEIQRKLIQFKNDSQSQVTFYLPQIHCSSCLWLLENIHQINEGITSTRVNFSKKEVFMVFDHKVTSLREVVETLDGIGYEPHLSLNEISSGEGSKTDRTRWYKIGVAGFCFSNIMMMSFADYFAIDNALDPKVEMMLKIIIVGLSLPVLFYSATEFFESAWSGVKNKFLNIDFPVALALVITFVRSMYEIFSGTGSGYLDSMSGIVFFMLIGRWLQARTYQTISFDRDYKSFFPIALNVIKDGVTKPTEISKVKEGDLVQVHSSEIVPVDAILSKGNAKIDYSFVSGESMPVQVNIGEMVYAGGKQMEGMLELLVVKEVSQSYLTNLWNNPVFNQKVTVKENTYDIISKYFTYVVLALGFGAGVYWYSQDQTMLAWNAVTTVLIVACPCALLLSQNYTNGNILRILGFNKFYLRSPEMIERMGEINHIVLDKTGTITQTSGANVRYSGEVMSNDTKRIVASLLRQSTHPASKMVAAFLAQEDLSEVVHYKETEGKGIEGWVEEKHIKMGSPVFVGGEYMPERLGTKVVLWMDGKIIGEFMVSNKYRFGVSQLMQSLKKHFSLSLISGDNDTELKNVQEILGPDSEILFHQSPQQKLDYVNGLQQVHRRNVMMVGDGLNDAGALKQSDVGIAVVDNGNNFTPSSDGIIEASVLTNLDKFIAFAKDGKRIVLLTFGISVTYNVIGLYFAMQGVLSPVIAAILMPCSSVTIILLTYGLSEWVAHRYGLTPKTPETG